jgi:hypothetical protein
MEPNFITSGDCTPVLSKDPKLENHIDHYEVGRKDMGTIWMLKDIPEYYTKGKSIYVDKYGSPWVKG